MDVQTGEKLDEENEPGPLFYFDSLQALFSRAKARVNSDLRRNLKLRDGFKTLVCHDMKGGYLPEDVACDEVLEISDSQSRPFVFLYWWYVDIFVYFSHHLITIPPVRWIRDAHEHGCICLGTFITEGDGGKAICDAVFSNPGLRNKLVKHMTETCVQYGFDGWLINIENVVERQHISELLFFLRELRQSLKSVVGSYTQLIWYDSVTRDGRLKWQNCLNEENKVFAEVVDGFYTNYNWSDQHLRRTARFLELNPKIAEPFDVYFGVDVFDRGSYCGGKLNTHLAVQAARNHGFSTAIFAPGWTAECCPSEECTLKMQQTLFQPMSQILRPRRLPAEACNLRTSVTAEYLFNFAAFRGWPKTFDNSRKLSIPYLLESDVELTGDGLMISGAIGVIKTLFLTDLHGVVSHQFNTQPAYESIFEFGVITRQYAAGCYDIDEIWCRKLVEVPVLLERIELTVWFMSDC